MLKVLLTSCRVALRLPSLRFSVVCRPVQAQRRRAKLAICL